MKSMVLDTGLRRRHNANEATHAGRDHYQESKALSGNVCSLITAALVAASLIVGLFGTATMWIRAEQLAESNAGLARENADKANEVRRLNDQLVATINKYDHAVRELKTARTELE